MTSWLENEEWYSYQVSVFNDNRTNVEILHTLDLLKIALYAEKLKVKLKEN